MDGGSVGNAGAISVHGIKRSYQGHPNATAETPSGLGFSKKRLAVSLACWGARLCRPSCRQGWRPRAYRDVLAACRHSLAPQHDLAWTLNRPAMTHKKAPMTGAEGATLHKRQSYSAAQSRNAVRLSGLIRCQSCFSVVRVASLCGRVCAATSFAWAMATG